MELNTFQIAQNQQNIEYYAYVREMMQTKQINYWIGNPSVQILNGTIYLKPCPNLQTEKQPQNFQQYLKLYHVALTSQNEQQKQKNRCLILIGIPNSKNPIEVCDRLGAYLSWIVQIRVVKTNHFKFYAMLFFMEDSDKAKKLQLQIDGDQYNSLEIQRLLIRQMDSVSFIHTQASMNQNQAIYQHWNKSATNQISFQKIPIEKIFLKSNIQSPQFASSPRKKQHYLKNLQNPININPSKQSQNNICVICFQQSQGTLISILCSHYFHVKCLSQWKQNTCPLCRYHQHPPLIKFCEKCNQCEGLWVCLVCGVRLCCGFNHDILGSDSHIYQHYLESQHRLSMELQTKFIFDASQPAFLHQMLYRQVIKSDGGSLSESETSSSNKKGKMTKMSQKISQYEQSISEQMQRQRIYFEQNINKEVKQRKDNIKQKKKKLAQLQQQMIQLNKQIQQTDTKKQQLQKTTAQLQKQLKVIQDVKKYWQKAGQKYKKQQKQKQQHQSRQIKKLDEIISQKKEELKDYRRNKQLSAKIKSNVGKDQVQTSIIFGGGHKDKKKKR